MRIGFFSAALVIAPLFLAACGKSPSGAADGDSADGVVISKTDMVEGDPAAPVTLLEYASVTCPHCAAFAEQVIPEIKEKYIDTGKLKLVFRAFPTPPQKYAVIGSVLARCAAEKSGTSAYFLVTNALFRTQHQWIGDNARADLIKIVAQAGMSEADFDACLKRQDLIDIINNNAKEGQEKYDVKGTPSFILNGKMMQFKTIDEFKEQIAAAVAAASPATGD